MIPYCSGHMEQRTIILAAPRGFCAGVTRAVETVEKAITLLGTPLYVHHEIVHNKHVLSELEKKGAVFVDNMEEVPAGNHVIISAHGASPAVFSHGRELGLKVLDATCPLVTKVHLEAVRYARLGYQIVFIGHKKHAETVGTVGEAPENITVVENREDIEKLDYQEGTKLACLTQTTLSVGDVKVLMEHLQKRFPLIETPKSSDICYATTNRQNAVGEIARASDIVFILGSANSSNSNRLREMAEGEGKPAYLIDNYSMIDPEWIGPDVKKIGVSAGASAPDILVAELVEHLKVKYNCNRTEEIIVKKEETQFQLPAELTTHETG